MTRRPLIRPGLPPRPTLEALSAVPEALAIRVDILPLRLDDGVILVGACGDPHPAALDAVRMHAGARRIEIHPLTAPAPTLELARLRAYASHRILGLQAAGSDDAVAMLTALLDEACGVEASDLHLDAVAGGLRVRRRIDGELHDRVLLPASLRTSLIARVKVLAGLDVAERRRPQDGRFEHALAGGSVDVRVATLPTREGERATLRLLPQDIARTDLADLGLPTHCASALMRATDTSSGLVLVCGPTGSGKTTTLHAALTRLATGRRNIVTLEDPIERRLDGISQTQVEADIGLTFATGLRHLLRHDPDVIMVGEIRDAETARLAVEAAHTGHLVLATMHTVDAPAALARLDELGVPSGLVLDTLRLVLAQRLLAIPCPSCALSPSGHAGPARRDCPACESTGTRGRVAIAEALELDTPLRDLLRGTDPAAAHAALRTACAPRLRAVAIERAAAGLAREDEALLMTPD